MKSLQWERMYHHLYYNNSYNPQALELWTAELIQDNDVTNQIGIYEYLLSGNEKTLNIRSFSNSTKQATYERQKGRKESESVPSVTTA